MPADLTRSETKHAVYETTTCCAYREYPKYVLPEGESDDIQIPISNCTRQIWDHKVVLVIWSVNLLSRLDVLHNILFGTLFSVIRQTTK